MKVAVCFSGELRSIDKCLPHMVEKFLSHFDDYDIFYHTWTDDPDLVKLSHLVKTERLKDLIIEPRITFDEKNYYLMQREEVSIQGFLRQLYCLMKCNDIKQRYEKDNNFIYDVVIRIRPDLLIKEVNLNEQSFHNLEKTLFVPEHDSWHGYNDRLYYSNSSNMDILANRFRRIDEYFNKGGIIHYETFFKYVVDYNDLDVKPLHSKSVLLRTNGELNGELLIPHTPIAPDNISYFNMFS